MNEGMYLCAQEPRLPESEVSARRIRTWALTLKTPMYLYSVVKKDTAPSLIASCKWATLSRTCDVSVYDLEAESQGSIMTSVRLCLRISVSSVPVHSV